MLVIQKQGQNLGGKVLRHDAMKIACGEFKEALFKT